eukprot:8537488-Pyramimonas_sp.AAC.1
MIPVAKVHHIQTTGIPPGVSPILTSSYGKQFYGQLWQRGTHTHWRGIVPLDIFRSCDGRP